MPLLFKLLLASFAILSVFPCWRQTELKLRAEVYSVMVTPHFVSGEIPGNDRNEVFTETYNPGALIKFFIRNTSKTDTVFPVVTFNGRTGLQLLNDKLVSYANTPDIRAAQTRLTSLIPPESFDYYLLNVTDSNFFRNGIKIVIKDSLTGRKMEEVVKIEKPVFTAGRILFTSSAGNKIPDGVLVYFRNNSDETFSVNEITLRCPDGTAEHHYWRDKVLKPGIKWFGKEGKIKSGDLSGAYIKTGSLNFGELLIEVGCESRSGKTKLIYAIKPMVIDFDFGMGWAERYLAGSEAFCKTVSLLHLNTVNGTAAGFYADSEKSGRYEIKKFARLQDVEEQSKPENLAEIHAAEHFGEPQFDRKPAQEIYNYYTAYRHSGYPSTLTLSHEPGFNRYCGVVDFPHFDAYRVTAPHADRWGGYTKYGERNVRWGAPLETIGDYMRTLHRISAPNPVAAWTQGISDGWSSRLRQGAGNPNDLEMRIQAYEAVANGALSLYWFNMSGKNIIKFRNNLGEIQKINREFKVIDDLLATSVPFKWENTFMDKDLNVLAGPDFAILFVTDLTYKVSQDNQFVPGGKRNLQMKFELPAYLSSFKNLLKISHAGVSEIACRTGNGDVLFYDEIENTGLYILYDKSEKDLFKKLCDKFNNIMTAEKILDFNPLINDTDFKILSDEVTEIDNKQKK